MQLVRQVNAFSERLVNRSDLYYCQWNNCEADGYLRIDGCVTPELIQKHLLHEVTLGLPSMDRECLSTWCAWDNDFDNGNLARIEGLLKLLGLNPIHEIGRAGREGHLWLFFDGKISAVHLQRFDKFVRQMANLTLAEPLEFMPKSITPNDANGIRLPLGLNRKSEANGAVGWFDGCPDHDTQAQLEWFANQPLNSAAAVDNLATELLRRDSMIFKPVKLYRGVKQSAVEVFADLKPVRSGEYFSCICPKCGERRAFFYESGVTLQCNRENNCEFKISVSDYRLRRNQLPYPESINEPRI